MSNDMGGCTMHDHASPRAMTSNNQVHNFVGVSLLDQQISVSCRD